MSLLEVSGVKFKYTDNDLYNDISFKINDGEHIVIVGKNGCGKSTFMNIITKNIIPDAGKVVWAPGVTFSYLDQHLEVKNDQSIGDYLYGVFKPLFDKEKEMNNYYKMLETAPEYDYERILNIASQIGEYLEKNNFYSINSTIGNVINGLGLDKIDMIHLLKNFLVVKEKKCS